MIANIPNFDNHKKSSIKFDRISVSVLGSTGSIGTQTLDVIRNNNSIFSVHSLSGYSNLKLLLKQIDEFKPEFVSVKSETEREIIHKESSHVPSEIFIGDNGTSNLVMQEKLDIVMLGISGFAALNPLMSAIESRIPVAIANKESLVAGADFITKDFLENPVPLIPVDSEHNAIFQALQSRPGEKPRKITITASGGPFYKYKPEDLKNITPEQAVKHPKWSMGKKISVDSATLMNKGLEVIEASVLFSLEAEDIEVVIHPECLFHGFVEYHDGSTVAVCYEPDMRVPILNALVSGSAHLHLNSSEYINLSKNSSQSSSSAGTPWLDFSKERSLNFHPVINEMFPAISLAYNSLKTGKSAPLVLNASNEIAVNAFLDKRICFTDIMNVNQDVLNNFEHKEVTDFDILSTYDQEAREIANNFLENYAVL